MQEFNAGHIGRFPSRKAELSPFTQKLFARLYSFSLPPQAET
jgi:hypothetical protein